MVDTDVVERARELREAGRSPREIARMLGLPPAQAKQLVRQIALDRADAGPDESVECWISSGWSAGLTFDSRPEWPVGESAPGSDGLVAVLISRRSRGGRPRLCGYLVDVYCLGVKNALGPEEVSARRASAFRRSYFSSYSRPPLSVPLDLAQHLVLGAVEYARGLGFEPHPDFAAAREYLGAWSGPSAIGFGRDGRPTYTAGPYDDAGRILTTLRRTVGDGNFEYFVPVG